jgi:hypothetical protein
METHEVATCSECGLKSVGGCGEERVPVLTPVTLARYLGILTDKERWELMRDTLKLGGFCKECLGTDLPCYCANDE